MNPFTDLQTPTQPSRFRRFLARTALVVFLVSLVLGLSLVGWRAKKRADALRDFARAEARARCAAVEAQFDQALTAAELLGALARQSGGAIPNFQKVGAEWLASRPALASLELQPGGVVSEVVPPQGRGVTGFNVLKDPAQAPGVYAAIQGRVLTVSGPLALYSGQPGIVARAPVFLRGRDGRDVFWGFTAASMRLSEALARLRVDELTKKGYDVAFIAPAPENRKGAVIASSRSISFADAVQEPVRARNVEFRIALQPRNGWVNKKKFLIEAAGALFVSSLLCLLVNLWKSRRKAESALADAKRRLDCEMADRKQAQEDCRSLKEGEAALQNIHKLTQSALSRTEGLMADMRTRMEDETRRAQDAAEATRNKLKQAELRADDLQARLDETVSSSEEVAQARQLELEETRAALKQARQTIAETQARLEKVSLAEKETAAATQTRIEHDQAILSDLQSRLNASMRSVKEEEVTNAARLREAEEINHKLTERLRVAEQAESRVVELTKLLQEAQAELARLRDALDKGASVTTEGRQDARPTLRQENGSSTNAGEIAEGSQDARSTLQKEDGSPRSASVMAAPVGSESSQARDIQAQETVIAPKGTKRKKARDDNQMDLFGAPPAVEAISSKPSTMTAEAEIESEPAPEASMPEDIGDVLEDFGPPAEIMASDTELEGDLAEDFTETVKTKEEKPAFPRPPATPPPVNRAQLRKVLNLMLPLVTGQDPGAMDCFKANRATFRSAFTPEVYVEFEQCIKGGDFNTALEHLKKAARKQGITV